MDLLLASFDVRSLGAITAIAIRYRGNVVRYGHSSCRTKLKVKARNRTH
jgi:hypothetical protein